MVFNSYLFICIYLPVCVAGWFVLNRVSHRAADWFLIAMGVWFYGCFGLPYLAVLGVSCLFNYVLGRLLRRRELPAADAGEDAGDAADGTKDADRRRRRSIAGRGIPAFGIAGNLLFLGWFKYLAPELSGFASIGLPVGLSFYTFSLISYLIETYRGEIAEESIREYLLYVTYFPKIIQGPITCYEEVMAQLRDPAGRRFCRENCARGLSLFVMGLAKKLLIADVLAGPAAYGIQSAYYLDTLSVLVAFSCYAMQLYMDFSGYCDMAMGLSRMLNIELPLNFDAPFKAESFPEFWKRWHMTLTRFFTRYVYIPLGGSRRGRARACRNVMIVFVLSALWHGLGGTYLVWGLLSGAFVVAGNLWQKGRGKPERMHRGLIGTMLRRAKVYFVFLLTLVFFGAPSLAYSGAVLRRFLVPTYPGWLYRMAAQMDPPEFWLLSKLAAAAAPGLADVVRLSELLLVLGLALFLTNAGRTAVKLSETMALSRRNAVCLGLLLALCLCSVSGVSTYLYFQF